MFAYYYIWLLYMYRCTHQPNQVYKNGTVLDLAIDMWISTLSIDILLNPTSEEKSYGSLIWNIKWFNQVGLGLGHMVDRLICFLGYIVQFEFWNFIFPLENLVHISSILKKWWFEFWIIILPTLIIEFQYNGTTFNKSN